MALFPTQSQLIDQIFCTSSTICNLKGNGHHLTQKKADKAFVLMQYFLCLTSGLPNYASCLRR